MSKWTKWIEYLGGDIPVWDDEKVKIDVGDGVWIGDSKYGKWRSASHYKRLKSNVKSVGTAQKLNATPVDGVFRAVPQPIIETIGFYITACGQKARITSVYSDNDGSATGVVFYAGDNPRVELFECWWGLSGVSLGLSKEPRNFDITGPWVEPEAEAEDAPSVGRWANVYKWPSGILEVNGAYPTKQAAKDGTFGSKTNYIGAVLLSHTEGK